MKVLRKIIAAFLSLAIINFSLIGVMALSLSDTYLNRDFYGSEFFRESLYPQIMDEIAKGIEEKNPELNQALSHQEVLEMVEVVIPASTLKTMAESAFDQLEQNPLPETIVISNEAIKKNIRIYVEENPKALLYINPDQLDYLASEIEIPFENLSPELQVTVQILSVNQSEGKIIFVAGMIVLIVLLFLVQWKPFSKAFVWMATTLVFSGIPLLPLAYTLHAMAQQWPDLDTELIQQFIKPVSDGIFFYGVILTSIGLFGFVDYFILKKVESQGHQ
ncbi:MAG: hypothetical protein ACD_28C00077G0004 [uncultured bacterium]|nr:MAG: hypothetical protein ACD_28C00077G0004 [uncultured bacterium]KKT75843.1 MAG: hypothetical protein UW70_C0027G0029 [Candidatus Peregrinibacteria bacterium GW2011_GWA2_44_7]